ncbi:methyltransferase domain-containing protein [Jiangella aurantiaca]|uniref:Arsenite methyltransferase n=1 Tax=Jiangella aurantiaca TaxID=2530373 RepID=A0A4R5ALV4_9ACTN|nr:methyltransferase domain-containing protein [Jiangella aurantiaca]TDD72024.1 methyltransferase domain-containing protein [Jiangella aurantiaca]
MNGDLMFQEEIRAKVRDAYGAIPAGAGRAMAQRFYSDEELSSIPERAVDWALGVGNPVRYAGLSPGDVVLDVGCGGGIDTVLAARRVGPAGRVIGLDMLAEMCDRARETAEEAGVGASCEFTTGLMEDMPLPDASVDVVVSNGVINLSPRKSRVLAEIVRVLVPGGRLCVADLTVEDDLPAEVLTSDAAWAGCISGALSERVFAKKLDHAGLVGVEMNEQVPFGLADVALYPLFTPAVLELMARVIPEGRRDRVAVGLIVRAAKPES